jgi:hypothetical protein
MDALYKSWDLWNLLSWSLIDVFPLAGEATSYRKITPGLHLQFCKDEEAYGVTRLYIKTDWELYKASGFMAVSAASGEFEWLLKHVKARRREEWLLCQKRTKPYRKRLSQLLAKKT